MKNFWLPVLLASTMVASCSKVPTTNPGGTGTLLLSTTVNNSVIDVQTRANVPLSDFTGYILTLDGPDIEEIPYPTDGKIEGLTPGEYSVGLSNMAADFTPAFDAPRYGGMQTATITAGGQTPVAIVLTQANAGVKFIYDPSLAEAGLGALTATVTQGINALPYEGANRNSTGYFTPGEVILTLDNGGETVTIGGNANKTYTLAAKELWTITLKVAVPTTGGLTISAEIDITVTDREDEVTIDIGDNGEETVKLISFNGLKWMDRNLGATAADFEGDWTNAIGSFYQWGRNSAFTATQNIETIPGPVTAQVAEENADKFITRMNGDWLDGTDNTRWQTAEKQPCPEGFRIPTVADFMGIFTPDGILVNTVSGPVSKTETLSGGSFSAQYWGDKSNTVYGIKKSGTAGAYYMKWEWLKTAGNNCYVKISRWDTDENATFTGKTLSDIAGEFAALGQAAETLSLPAAGNIIGSGGYYSAGSPGGYYWASSLNGSGSHRAEFTVSKMITGGTYNSRISGHSVRCVKQ